MRGFTSKDTFDIVTNWTSLPSTCLFVASTIDAHLALIGLTTFYYCQVKQAQGSYRYQASQFSKDEKVGEDVKKAPVPMTRFGLRQYKQW